MKMGHLRDTLILHRDEILLVIRTFFNGKCAGQEEKLCFNKYLNTLKVGGSQYGFFPSVTPYEDRNMRFYT